MRTIFESKYLSSSGPEDWEILTFFAESYIDKQLNSTYVLRDLTASGKIVGSIRAEVGDDDVVYLGPFAIAPDLQVGTRRPETENFFFAFVE